MPSRPSRGPLRRAGTLSPAALRRRVAQQSQWCVVDRETGDVLKAVGSRSEARGWRDKHARSRATRVLLVGLRVSGERA